jgi:ribosomal protein L21E
MNDQAKPIVVAAFERAIRTALQRPEDDTGVRLAEQQQVDSYSVVIDGHERGKSVLIELDPGLQFSDYTRAYPGVKGFVVSLPGGSVSVSLSRLEDAGWTRISVSSEQSMREAAATLVRRLRTPPT